MGGVFPDIFWDGIGDPARMKNKALTENQIPAIQDNGQARFTNFDLSHMNPRDLLTGRHRTCQRAEITPDQPTLTSPKVILARGKPPRKDASERQYLSTGQAKKNAFGIWIVSRRQLADSHLPSKECTIRMNSTPHCFSDYTQQVPFLSNS